MANRLKHNGFTYYARTITTSPFGGKMSDRTLMKIHDNGQIIKLTDEQWGSELSDVVVNTNIEYDMEWHDPFIDYR